jgi:AraC-like DNA-binding protein
MHHHLRVPGDSATLSDWSALTGISTSALSRTWTKVTGQNFRTWRSHLRMSAARELLSSGRPVSEVSRLLGYSDRAGFTKAFTGFFGTGPGSYRRNVTDGAR